MADDLIRATKKLSDSVNRLRFSAPTTHVYNPLAYAWESHEIYLRRFGLGKKKTIFLGMNPGPWGMAQVGVPFGEVSLVRDWMKIECSVKKPDKEHPKRPIEGFACKRSEVSGRRLWGFFRDRFGAPEKFFADHFVLNYCPLVFMEESGRNRTPDKLPAEQRRPLEGACDDFLKNALEILEPEHVVGVGGFAEQCLLRNSSGGTISRILHPSPASPAANRDWAGAAERALVRSGIWPKR
ncbi:MAG: uracil-DNA glycosylase family protein [Verrucomicrobiota bacterium]